MGVSDDERLAHWWDELVSQTAGRADAVHSAYQHLENAGLISKVTVHRYVCESGDGHPVLTIIKVGDNVVARTRDNKLSRGLNYERSVASARERNTLDGERHWPGSTFDVLELAEWGAGVDATCRHRERMVLARDMLSAIDGVTPGHPRAPTRC